MNSALLAALLVLAVVNAVLLMIVLMRSSRTGQDSVALRDELRQGRDEARTAARESREELSTSLKSANETLATTLTGLGEVGETANSGVQMLVLASTCRFCGICRAHPPRRVPRR